MLNILPFIEPFIREWIKINSLIIHRIIDKYRFLDLYQIIKKFLKNKKLEGKVDLSKLIPAIIDQKDQLKYRFGIELEPNEESNNALIISYPVLEQFMADNLIEDELAYFLARLFSKATTEVEQQNYFV